MKRYVYTVICTDHANWNDASLWAEGYETAAKRVFPTRRGAMKCYRAHADYDYRATAIDPDAAGDRQPSFEIRKRPTLEVLDEAEFTGDLELFDVVCRMAHVRAWDRKVK